NAFSEIDFAFVPESRNWLTRSRIQCDQASIEGAEQNPRTILGISGPVRHAAVCVILNRAFSLCLWIEFPNLFPRNRIQSNHLVRGRGQVYNPADHQRSSLECHLP